MQSKKVLDSIEKCVEDLYAELRKITEIDCDDSVRADKYKRKIDAWFRNYGRIKKPIPV